MSKVFMIKTLANKLHNDVLEVITSPHLLIRPNGFMVVRAMLGLKIYYILYFKNSIMISN